MPVMRSLLIANVSARILLLLVILAVNPRLESVLLLDAPRFVTEARNLLAWGVLSQSPAPPVEPTMFDVPVYPLVLAGVFGLFGPRAGIPAALVVNIVALAGCVALVHALLRRLYDERAARRGAVLLSVFPTTFFYPFVVMPDVLFLFFFVAFLYFLVAHLASGAARDAVLAGASLALSILTKPVGVGFVVIGSLVLVAAHGRRALKPVALFAGATLLILSPWIARNSAIFGSPSLTNVADATLYKEYVQMASTLRGLPPEQVMTADVLELRARYDTEFHSVPAPDLAVLRRYATEGMRGHWLFYFTRVHFRHVYLFMGASTSGLFRLFGVDLAPRWIDVVRGARERGLRDAVSRIAADRELTAYVVLQSAAGVVVAAVFALGTVGLIRALTRRDLSRLWLPGAGIAYLVVMTGPFSNSRYALPILPFVLMLGAGVLAGPRATPAPGDAR